MHNPPDTQQYLNSTLLRGGFLAVGILWLLAFWSFGGIANYSDASKGRSGFAATVDMPLHANGEHSFSVKRSFTRAKDQPKSLELPEPGWALAVSEFIAALPLVAANQQSLASNSPFIGLYQLQTLNIPRAPPLV